MPKADGEITQPIVRLWHIYQKVELKDRSGKPVLNAYVKALSDAEQKQRALIALRAAREFRKAALTPGTDEHELYLASVREKPRAELEAVILRNNAAGFRTEADQIYPGPAYVPFPDDDEVEEGRRIEARAEALERRQAAVREYQAKVAAYIAEKLEEHRAWLRTLSEEEIRDMGSSHVLEALAYEEHTRAFIHASLYLAYFTNEALTERYFANPEEVAKWPSAYIARLFAAFKEVNEIDPLSS